MAQVPLAIADQRPLVALHALQLLLGGHPASGLAAGGWAALCGGQQALKGAFGSVLKRQRWRREGRGRNGKSS